MKKKLTQDVIVIEGQCHTYHTWKKITPKASPTASFVARQMQQAAFDRCKTADHCLVNACPGSGKSTAVCMLIEHRLRQDPSLRAVIAVPQTMIAKSFINSPFTMKTGVKWLPRNNLCDEDVLDTVAELITFLAAPAARRVNDRVLICTHATLVFAFDKLKKSNKLSKVLRDTVLWIDEAHHGMNEADGLNNRIGAVMNYVLDRSAQNLFLGLITATFFRSDRLQVIAPRFRSKLVTYEQPFDEYFAQLQHLKTFSFDYALVKTSWLDAISVLTTERRKTIIYIPHPISNLALGCKYESVTSIVDRLHRNFGGRRSVLGSGVIVFTKSDGSQYKILNLVDEQKMSEKKRYLNMINGEHDALDCIITINMFKEGADWEWADQAIVIGARESIQTNIQIFGRLTRDKAGKSHVNMVQVLPWSLDQNDEQQLRTDLNRYVVAIIASMLMENVLLPKLSTKHDRSSRDRAGETNDVLQDIVRDVAKQERLLRDSLSLILDLSDRYQDRDSLHAQYRSRMRFVIKRLDRSIDDVDVDRITALTWNMWSKRSLTLAGINVDDITFELLQRTDPRQGLLQYVSECGLSTLKHMRSLLRTYNTVSEQKVYPPKQFRSMLEEYKPSSSRVRLSLPRHRELEAVHVKVKVHLK